MYCQHSGGVLGVSLLWVGVVLTGLCSFWHFPVKVVREQGGGRRLIATQPPVACVRFIYHGRTSCSFCVLRSSGCVDTVSFSSVDVVFAALCCVILRVHGYNGFFLMGGRRIRSFVCCDPPVSWTGFISHGWAFIFRGFVCELSTRGCVVLPVCTRGAPRCC